MITVRAPVVRESAAHRLGSAGLVAEVQLSAGVIADLSYRWGRSEGEGFATTPLEVPGQPHQQLEVSIDLATPGLDLDGFSVPPGSVAIIPPGVC